MRSGLTCDSFNVLSMNGKDRLIFPYLNNFDLSRKDSMADFTREEIEEKLAEYAELIAAREEEDEFVDEPDEESEVPEEEDTQETSEGEAKALPNINGTILYIEDQPTNLDLMNSIVAHIEGLSIIPAQNAEAGIKQAAVTRPDLIILDIDLPGMTGFEALKKLKNMERTKSIPVIALSAYAMPSDIEKGISAGFREYLTKPIKIDDVAGAIKDILDT